MTKSVFRLCYRIFTKKPSTLSFIKLLSSGTKPFCSPKSPLEKLSYVYLRVYAGGVCHRLGKYCNATDMKELEWEFAAYQAHLNGSEEEQRERDVAIIQLKEDLTLDDESIKPICLPTATAGARQVVNVYGWGLREGTLFMTKFF